MITKSNKSFDLPGGAVMKSPARLRCLVWLTEQVDAYTSVIYGVILPNQVILSNTDDELTLGMRSVKKKIEEDGFLWQPVDWDVTHA